MEDPEIKPHSHRQLIFDERAKDIAGKTASSTMALGKLAIYLHETETSPYLSPCAKIPSKWTKCLHVRPGTLKLLGKCRKTLEDIDIIIF
jgi:hypothetical protein